MSAEVNLIRVPDDVRESGVGAARIRCGRPLGHPDYRTCDRVLSGAEVDDAGYLFLTSSGDDILDRSTGTGRKAYRSRPHLVGREDNYDGGPVDRVVVRCRCGASHVLRGDRILGGFVAAVRAGANEREVNVPGVGRRLAVDVRV